MRTYSMTLVGKDREGYRQEESRNHLPEQSLTLSVKEALEYARRMAWSDVKIEIVEEAR